MSAKFHGGRFLGVVFAVAMLTACAGGGAPKDIELKGELIAAGNVNPNRNGRASPVKVVVFHLRNSEAFLAGDFFSLYDRKSAVLADDQISRVDIQITPGQQRALGSEFDPETRFIGVLAAFQQIDQANWRALLPLPETKLREKLNPFAEKKLRILVEDLSVNASIEKQ